MPGWIGGGMGAGDASLGHVRAGAFDDLASLAGAFVVLVLARIDRDAAKPFTRTLILHVRAEQGCGMHHGDAFAFR